MTPIRVLVIDDERAIRDSFSAHLEDCGYEILSAENGRLGLALFETKQPDLVLVDLRMPEMDGIEVLEQVRRQSPLTPLIVVSGTGMINDAVEALHCGAWDYLLKPIENMTVLTHAVAAALEKSRLKKENQAYREHLEQLVQARTAELEIANSRLSRINSRLRHIVETTRALSFCTEVRVFGSQLLQAFGQHMRATGGSIYLKEEKGLRLVVALDEGHAAGFIPFPLPEKSLFQRAIGENRPILVDDIKKEGSVAPSGWSRYKDGSALVFPLPDEHGGIAGIMALHNKRSPPFVEQDLEIGTILASYSCEALRAVRASEALRASEARFRKILDTIPTGIIIVEAQTDGILYANPTAAALVGYEPEAIVGQNCHKVICPAQGSHCPMHQGKEYEQCKQTLLRADGKKIPIIKTASRTSLAGRECYIESFIDLSQQEQLEADRERLETQLRQAQKMEALGTLAGGIAHDFNNILSAVLGYSELGMQDIGGPAHPLYPKLKAIHHAGLRARDLVAQILSFSRMQEQLQAPVKIAPIVKEALKLLRTSLPANIQVKSSIKADRPVLGDPTQIHQIIMNLCTNAYHAMEQSGGTLEASLEEVAIEAPGKIGSLVMNPGPYLRLIVSDTGAGISPAILERIFDPYFTTKEKGKGTGLGLAVVHGIVKSHRGEIAVESKVGKGTAFTVFLPVSEEASSGKGPRPAALPRGSEHILLVDDEKDLVTIGREMLQRLGYKVTAVVGSAEALERFKAAPRQFDLVITDYNMPGLTGDRMARSMLATRPDMPIIVCTGFAEVFDLKQAKATGIRRILMKPLTMESMATAVREVLETY
jgi:PAS domain S-box-containing protein